MLPPPMKIKWYAPINVRARANFLNVREMQDQDGEDEDLASEFDLEASPSQLSDELITLSNEAATKYKTLVNLDLIRVRLFSTNCQCTSIPYVLEYNRAHTSTMNYLNGQRLKIIKFAFFGNIN